MQAIKCEGKAYTNQSGSSQGVGSAGGFNEILKGAMGLLQGFLQQQQQQQQNEPLPPYTGSTTPTCTSYYQVTAPSSDPCATYIPPISDSLGVGDDASDSLLDALGGSTVSDQLSGALNVPAGTDTSGTSTLGDGLGNAVVLQGGTQGDIQFGASRTTVIATSRDPNANTEIAGFYGGSTLGSEQPQSLAARMCKSRPWAATAITYVIPPTFFDSLCAARGYQVGSPAPTPKPAPAVKPPPPPAATTTPPAPPPPAAPTVPPEVDIWAVPATVSLGSRTTIFWNTKGVDSCTVLSPDGSFDEKTLSGGAATVPLSGATTFTISCLTSGGTAVTDYVTVNMAI